MDNDEMEIRFAGDGAGFPEGFDIRRKYSEVSVSAEGKFSYPTGKEGAELLGYEPRIIAKAPPELLKSFCGVGNPFSLGAIPPGSKPASPTMVFPLF